MSFQSGINQAIGSVGALAGVGKMVKNQEKANELAEKNNKLAELDAKEKAINEYAQNNEPATQAYDEHQAQVNKLNQINTELGAFGSDQAEGSIQAREALFAVSPQAKALFNAKQSLTNEIEAKQYQNNLLRMRMQVQDERWKALGVNKEELKQLNSNEDQKKIHEFKKGVN